MPGALTFISKGSMLQRVDKAYERPTPQQLKDLKNPARPLSDNAKGLEILSGPDDVAHAAEFMAGTGAFWSGHSMPESIESILRGGYATALEIALKYWEPKPVVSYWVTGVAAFEVVVSETDQEVQVYLLTPTHVPQQRRGAASSRVEERIWVVADEQRISELRGKLGPFAPEDARPIGKKVMVQRTVGY